MSILNEELEERYPIEEGDCIVEEVQIDEIRFNESPSPGIESLNAGGKAWIERRVLRVAAVKVAVIRQDP